MVHGLQEDRKPLTLVDACKALGFEVTRILQLARNDLFTKEMMDQLKKQCGDIAESERPLLLLTTATADRVTNPDGPADAEGVDLTRVYPDRTFRYCFSNKQMAAAVMRAEALSRKPGYVGAVAFSRTVDPATGNLATRR